MADKLTKMVNGEVIELTPEEEAAWLAEKEAARTADQQRLIAEAAREADLDLVRKANNAITQMEADLAAIDTMTLAQVRDVVKRLLVINIGQTKALKRIL